MSHVVYNTDESLNSDNYRSRETHTLATLISATTQYSEKVDVPIKWNNFLLLQEYLEVPSGMTPLPEVMAFT